MSRGGASGCRPFSAAFKLGEGQVLANWKIPGAKGPGHGGADGQSPRAPKR